MVYYNKYHIPQEATVQLACTMFSLAEKGTLLEFYQLFKLMIYGSATSEVVCYGIILLCHGWVYSCTIASYGVA